MTAPHSTERVADDLRRLGVTDGDIVMVHASLRAIGPVDGGADGVIEAIQAVIGSDGTMLMTLGARDDWGWINERPIAERAALLRDAEPFDAARTPADPDVGVLAEVFRRRAETLVSDHPEGRFGASGRHADAFVADVPWDDYYGVGSPLERLVQRGGRILRLGADPDTVTALHYAEWLAPIADKRRVRRDRMVIGVDGPRHVVVHTIDDSNGIVDHPGEDYFAVILRAYLDGGRAAVGRVGGAVSELIDASDLVSFGVGWMTEHLGRG